MNNIRKLPGWQLARRLKRAGRNQFDIAARARVSQATVCRVIYRRAGTTPETAERVWQALEKVLAPSETVSL